jgi:hypothetical protein
MSLPLTPQRLAGVYEMLRGWPPFCRWGLPHAGEMKFHLARTRRWDAAWWINGDKHHIEVSTGRHGHMNTLVCSMAHEMVHVKQRKDGTETSGVEHNAEFHRLARLICRRYGWDEKQFL